MRPRSGMMLFRSLELLWMILKSALSLQRRLSNTYNSKDSRKVRDATMIVVKFVDVPLAIVLVSAGNRPIFLLHCEGDSSAWFASTYLGSNSWSDLSPSSTFNYFGIAGHSEISRNWFINS